MILRIDLTDDQEAALRAVAGHAGEDLVTVAWTLLADAIETAAARLPAPEPVDADATDTLFAERIEASASRASEPDSTQVQVIGGRVRIGRPGSAWCNDDDE